MVVFPSRLNPVWFVMRPTLRPFRAANLLATRTSIPFRTAPRGGTSFFAAAFLSFSVSFFRAPGTEEKS